MALQVQNIINDVSTDVRSVLGNSGSDATLMIPWVDRIHKDCLHTSVYRYLTYKNTSQVLTANTATYTLAATDIRRILVVYDTTFSKLLMPLEAATAPQAMAQSVSMTASVPEEATRPKPVLSHKTDGKFPEYWFSFGTSGIYIVPAPASASFAGTLNITYESQVTTLANLTDTLVIPEDGKDMMVAGVNYLALEFLVRTDEAMRWLQIYEALKQGAPTSAPMPRQQ